MNQLKINKYSFLFLIILGFTSCAPAEIAAHEYGFLGGVWHSIIFPFSSIGKIFGLDINILADNNTGFTYYLGFIISSIIEIFIILGLSNR